MFDPAFVDQVLALPTLDAQRAQLQSANQLTPAGLDELLDTAEQLAGVDPDRSLQLAQLAAQLGNGQPVALAPRAAYLQAQIHAVKGQFQLAEQLVTTARTTYEQLGLTVEAVRTTVGLMRILGETGRYNEALAAARRALSQIGADVATTEAVETRAVAARLWQNYGFCSEQIGRYTEALQAYDAAEQRYAELGMAQERAQVIENRGLVLVALGQVQAGLTAFETALHLQAQAPQPFYEAQTLINIGEARLLLSQHLSSLQAFEAAARQLESLGETVDRYILLRQMGDAYLALNLYAEAEDAYQRAQSGLAAAGLTLHLALSQWGLGAVLTARGRLVEAGEQMVAAGQLFDQLENRPLRSAVLLEESRLRELSGAAQQARTLAQSALDLVIGTNWTVQQIYAYLRNADLAYPDLARVESLLNQAQPLVDALQLPHFRYRLQGRWGRLRLRQGDGAAAQPLLESAISEIEQLRNTLVHERLRAAFLQDKTEVYQDLVQLHLDRGDVADIRTAFTVAEQAKSRALVDLIAGVVRTQRSTISGEQANVELLQQLDALQAELNAVYSELLGGPDDGSVRTAGSTILLARAAQLEQTISHLQLRRQIVEVAPDALHAGSTFAVAPPAVDSPRQVVYHILGEEVLAFLCRAGRIDTIRGLTTVTRVRELAGRLAAQWARFRIHPSFIQAHQRQLELTAQRLLHHLYCELLAPIIGLLDGESASAGVTPLVIVPHDLLHQLPFHAFYDGQQYLLERFAISYAPSATVFALCQQRQRRNTGPALALAAPDAQIPAAAQEVEQVASALRAAGLTVHTLVQQAATSAALRTLADHCRLLHLACHGLFRRDTPMFSALKLDDGWLTAGEMAQLDLHGALVTLSACESGRSQVIGGDELLGLTYAVLSAGAASLVVSQWLVQDGVTAELMAHWYQLLTQVDDLALALRTAQLAVMAQHSHPYYWAPFVVVGRRTNG